MPFELDFTFGSMPFLPGQLTPRTGPPSLTRYFDPYFGLGVALPGPQVRSRIVSGGGGTLPRMQRIYSPPSPPSVPAPVVPGMLARYFSHPRPTSRTIFASRTPRPSTPTTRTTRLPRRPTMPFDVPFLSGRGGTLGTLGGIFSGVGQVLQRIPMPRTGPQIPFPLPQLPDLRTGLSFQAGCGCLTRSGRKGRMVYDSRQGSIVCKQVRRLNPANGRAAIRAVRRISATHKLLRRIEKAMQKTCRRGGVSRRGSFSFGRRKKKSCS
jgi:hypothetical protein